MFKFPAGIAGTKIDAVRCLQGEFAWYPMQEKAELTMVYANAKTGETFGSCPMRESLMSKTTKEAMDKFLSLAEEDFAAALMTQSTSDSDKVHEDVTAESSGGLGNPFRRD